MKNIPQPRVVIDTNVLISGLVFGGNPRKVLDLIADRSISVFLAQELLTELRRKIIKKFPDFVGDLERLEQLLIRDGIVVKLGMIEVAISRDPNDNMFIETALIGNCDYIISGDKDLLVLKNYKNVSIVTPKEFLDTFENM